MPLYTYAPETVFYPLVRFSTVKQADGDSFRRQVEAAETFALQEGIPLDRMLHETDIRKHGMSAFSGEHIIKGPLKKFLQGIEDGIVKPGKAALLLSEWNRLTRQISSDAVTFAIDLMRKGIGIIDLQDRAYYTLDRYNNDTGVQLGLHLKISMAHQYSKNLSHNLTAAWQGRRKAMRNGNGKPTNACTEWLRVGADGEFEAIPEREVIIHKIIAWRHEGKGKHFIANRLNETDPPTPAFRGGELGWWPSAVERLVKNEALMGIYQPRHADDTPDGEPIPGWYPVVVKPDDFWRAQWPKNGDPAPSGRKNGNLIKFVKCGTPKCGATLVYVNKGSHNTFLVCSKARRGLCTDRTHHPYPELETGLLWVLTRIGDLSRLIARGDPHTAAIEALRAEIADKSDRIAAWAANPAALAIKEVADQMIALAAQRDTLTARLADMERADKIAEATKNHGDFDGFMEMAGRMYLTTDAQEEEELRTKMEAELRRRITTAIAVGQDITMTVIETPGRRLELLFHRAKLDGLRLVTIFHDGSEESQTLLPEQIDSEGAGILAEFLAGEDQ
jgi:DNA invertase Pin-like site-specific DNA recombinase